MYFTSLISELPFVANRTLYALCCPQWHAASLSSEYQPVHQTDADTANPANVSGGVASGSRGSTSGGSSGKQMTAREVELARFERMAQDKNAYAAPDVAAANNNYSTRGPMTGFGGGRGDSGGGGTGGSRTGSASSSPMGGRGHADSSGKPTLKKVKKFPE